MTQMLTHHIAAAADGIVQAFARNDESDYFTRFSPECTFVFAPDNVVHRDRASWLAEWRILQESGWRVTHCQTLESGVHLLPNGGVFWHLLETTSMKEGVSETYRERETIVFEQGPEGLLAVHEHLSPATEEGPQL